MRVLAGGDPRRPLAAAVTLGGRVRPADARASPGPSWTPSCERGPTRRPGARRSPRSLGRRRLARVRRRRRLAASPTPGAGGDPRSSGQGPGLVGDPAFAILAVVAIGVGALVVTLAYVRLTGGRALTRPSPGGDRRTRAERRDVSHCAAPGAACRDHRPIGKNCEIGRLGASTSHFLPEPVEHRPSLPSRSTRP